MVLLLNSAEYEIVVVIVLIIIPSISVIPVTFKVFFTCNKSVYLPSFM